ncbi:MAG: carbohydrate kinase [Eubacteriales bacterium]|nr:carbohydrate kinase [Eubacteriales bacterium]
MFDVIALGESLIDFSPVSTDEYGYPTMAAHPGGAPANYLAALSKYGAKTAMIGKVGDDAFGRLLLKTMDEVGISTKGMIADPGFFTTLAFVTLGENGARDFSFARKPGADTKLSFDEINLSMLDDCRVLHIGTLSLTDEPIADATKKLVAYAKEKGTLISCDPNLRKPLWDSLDRAKDAMLYAMGQADIIKISDDEVDFLWGIKADEDAARMVLEKTGARLVFVTCGAKGVYFANAKTEGFVPALSGVKPVDTTGAGDIFGGSAAWRFLEENTAPEELERNQIEEIVRFAATAAGLSTEKFGGISSVPEYEDVMKIL